MMSKKKTGVYPPDVFVGLGARFSPDRVWRYQLWRIWNADLPILNVIGLNPSTADDKIDDPTIRRCVGFAVEWGYGGLEMTNIFAYRATLPAEMKKATDPIGPENDKWLKESAAHAGLVVAAWGVHGSFLGRDRQVREMIEDLYCFRLTRKTNVPEHPLYLPANTRPILWRFAE